VQQTGDSSSCGTDQLTNVSALVLRARDGDQSAFEALYSHYCGQISRYVGRLVGNDGLGCELAQDIFLKAWTSLPGLREPERFVSWLYRIATNCAYDYQRRTRHMQTVSLEIYTGNEEALSIAGPEKGVEETEMLRIALAQVPQLYRECLILYEVEGLPQRQIAELLSMKEASVSKYVSRGKEKLRQIYYQLVREQSDVPVKGGKRK
jgi:RNA polymerase sigma-70 factor (ECF subfamily)